MYQSMTIPGGWGEEVPEAEKKTINPTSTTSAPVLDSTTQQPKSTTQAEEYDETTDDNSSVYSDAYEDLSDGEGFGSINALMEKPVAASSSGLMSSRYANGDATDKAKNGWAQLVLYASPLHQRKIGTLLNSIGVVSTRL